MITPREMERLLSRVLEVSLDTGVCTSGDTVSLVDSKKNWGAGMWKDGILSLVKYSGNIEYIRLVTNNSANVIFFSSISGETAVSGDTYGIRRLLTRISGETLTVASGNIHVVSGNITVISGDIRAGVTSGLLAIQSGLVAISSGNVSVVSGDIRAGVTSGLLAIQSGLVGVTSGEVHIMSGSIGAQVSGGVQVSGAVIISGNVTVLSGSIVTVLSGTFGTTALTSGGFVTAGLTSGGFVTAYGASLVSGSVIVSGNVSVSGTVSVISGRVDVITMPTVTAAVSGSVTALSGSLVGLHSGAWVQARGGVTVSGFVSIYSGLVAVSSGEIHVISGQLIAKTSGELAAVGIYQPVAPTIASGQVAPARVDVNARLLIALSGESITISSGVIDMGIMSGLVGILSGEVHVMSGQVSIQSGAFVSISGQPTIYTPTSVWTNEVIQVTAASGGAAIPSNTVKSMKIKSLSGGIWVGGTTQKPYSGFGFLLAAGEVLSLDLDDFSRVRLCASTSGDWATVIGVL